MAPAQKTEIPDLKWADQPIPAGTRYTTWLRRCPRHGPSPWATTVWASTVVDWLANDTDLNLAYSCGCVLRVQRVVP